MKLKHQITTLLILYCSCGQKKEPIIKSEKPVLKEVVDSVEKISSLSISTASDLAQRNLTELTQLNWAKHNESIRNEILKSKENKILKESFLQEMYITNLARVSNDSVFVNIPFDLHGLDCMAPDGYVTDVSFSIKLGDTLIFPEKLKIQEHEHGIVEKEIRLSGFLTLVEKTDQHVVYHSADHKRTLILFNSAQDHSSNAFYFSGIDLNRIKAQSFSQYVKEYDEEDKNSIFPFTSRVLLFKDYDYYLSKPFK
jgi:hypothetical protein